MHLKEQSEREGGRTRQSERERGRTREGGREHRWEGGRRRVRGRESLSDGETGAQKEVSSEHVYTLKEDDGKSLKGLKKMKGFYLLVSFPFLVLL